MKIATIGKNVQKFAIDNSPTLLTAAAVTGTVLTAVLAGKSAIRAAQILDQARIHAEHQKLPPLEGRDYVQLTWREFAPPVLTGCLTIVCIIGANQIGSRRYAALAAAGAITEQTFDIYKQKVVEKLGEKKERAVRDEIAQDEVRDNPVRDAQIIIAAGGDVLCRDSLSGRYFQSDIATMRRAENETNSQINNDFYASLSDFYKRIGLSQTRMSEELGWNSDKLMNLSFSSTIAEDGRPCLVLEYDTVPIRNYYRVS